MREALTIEVDGLRLHGTRHAGSKPCQRGVLFLNFGYQPRSARGDLAVHLADELAAADYVCYRFDLPGLGDSEGEVPKEVLEFYEFVQQGGYADCTAKLASRLVAEQGLQDVALLGLCGGAITSIFAAASLKCVGISGLVLLDPQFFLYQRAEAAKANLRNGKDASGWLKKSYAAVHDRLLESRLEPYLSAVYGGLIKLSATLRRNRLPKNANLPLLTTLFNLLDQKLPVLAITAHPPSPVPPGFEYLEYIQKASRNGMSWVKVQHTTHSFVENGGPAAVLREVTGWLAGLRPAGRQQTCAGSGQHIPSPAETRAIPSAAAG